MIGYTTLIMPYLSTKALNFRRKSTISNYMRCHFIDASEFLTYPTSYDRITASISYTNGDTKQKKETRLTN